MAIGADPNTRRRHGERGVTVGELVLVVVFVAGLLLVATTASRAIGDETASSNCQTELRTLKLATERYHAENDTYPSDKTVLVNAGLVGSDEVENWEVIAGATDAPPDYRPGGPCA
jgi:Tfp pilus assembly protein PilE